MHRVAWFAGLAALAFLRLRDGATGPQKLALGFHLAVVLILVLEHLDRLRIRNAVHCAEDAGHGAEDAGRKSGLLLASPHPYRVGDLYRLGHSPATRVFGYEKTMLAASEFHARHFPNSVAARYAKCIGVHDTRNTACLQAALTAHCDGATMQTLDPARQGELYEYLRADHSSTPGTAVFHLRLGDVLTDPFAKLLTSSGTLQDHLARVRDCARRGLRRILFVGGLHTPVGEAESLAMIRRLEQHAALHGLDSLVVSGTPDSDLCVLSRANLLVSQRKSGYSIMAQDVALARGKAVLGVDGVPVTRKSGNLVETRVVKGASALLFALAAGLALRAPPATPAPPVLRLYAFAALILSFGALVFPLVKHRPDRNYAQTAAGASYGLRLNDTASAYVVWAALLFLGSATLWSLCHGRSPALAACAAATWLLLAGTATNAPEYPAVACAAAAAFLCFCLSQGRARWLPVLALLAAGLGNAAALEDPARAWGARYCGQVAAAMLGFAWIGANS